MTKAMPAAAGFAEKAVAHAHFAFSMMLRFKARRALRFQLIVRRLSHWMAPKGSLRNLHCEHQGVKGVFIAAATGKRVKCKTMAIVPVLSN